MSGAAYEDSDGEPTIPEPETVLPARNDGFAGWSGTRDNGPPPFEESAAQVEARRRYRGEADPESLERRRKRVARVARQRESLRFDRAGE